MENFYIFRDIETFSILHILSEFSLNANLTSSRIYVYVYMYIYKYIYIYVYGYVYMYICNFFIETKVKYHRDTFIFLEIEKLHAKKNLKISSIYQTYL